MVECEDECFTTHDEELNSMDDGWLSRAALKSGYMGH